MLLGPRIIPAGVGAAGQVGSTVASIATILDNLVAELLYRLHYRGPITQPPF